MMRIDPSGLFLVLGAALLVPVLGGCATPLETNAAIAGGVVGGTILGAQAPGHQIEQVYYLGCFDPRDQLPPTVYRVTVRGQASAISLMHFGSGWVQAGLIDSLNTNITIDKSGRPSVTSGNGESQASIQTGRRLVLFGPEGFREAPKDHRLVIVMGSNPEAFFNAIDSALGTISQAEQLQANSDLSNQVLQAMASAQSEQQRLSDVSNDVTTDLADTSTQKGANP